MEETVAEKIRMTGGPAPVEGFESAAAEIKRIISEIIEIPLDEIDCDAHLLDDLGVDSLLALEVLSALEKRFRIEVPEEELIQFTTVNKIIEVARQKLSPEAGALADSEIPVQEPPA